MTVTETLTPRQHRTPYPPPATHSPAASTTWDSRLDTVPLLRATDVRAMERLRAIRDCAQDGLADIDAVLANPPTPDQDGTR
ncbi:MULTISPECIES: hypothetical protein [Nonomuraea]|uniref:FXSXX-COOH protein n=1 Tax=Nonomuraea salmonea TaxID=46181 RepID=A0ABV5NMV9_9ACTN